jgi:hypothetical protein
MTPDLRSSVFEWKWLQPSPSPTTPSTSTSTPTPSHVSTPPSESVCTTTNTTKTVGNEWTEEELSFRRMSLALQLQRLFGYMQLSQKSALLTRDLTTSFGWQVRMTLIDTPC